MIPPYSDLDPRALTTMTSELVSACGGTRAAARLLRTPAGGMVAESHVSAWASLSDMTRFMPLHHVQRLEIACEQPIVSSYMVGRLARDGSGRPGELTVDDFLALTHGTGRLTSDTAQAFGDGRVDAAERETLLENIRQVEALLDAMKRKAAQ